MIGVRNIVGAGAMKPISPVEAAAAGRAQAEALAPAERLLLWCMRAWATVRLSGERPQTSLIPMLSARASPRAAALFGAWMQAIEAGASRKLRIQCGACTILSPDEERLLLAAGLAPVAMEAGHGLLRPLLPDPEPTMALARALNRTLAADGWRLPARLSGGFAELQPQSPTIH
jgi:hypothetical protein